MQELINAVVIDDQAEHIVEITTAFASKGISTLPVHYKDPTSAYKLCSDAAGVGPRVIITDIQMREGGTTPTRTDLANVTRCLKEIAQKINGPYVILAWTSVPDSFDQLKEYVTRAFGDDIQMPVYFDSICKNACKPDGAAFNADLILEKFSEHLDAQKQVKALMHWEKSILYAASSSVNELVEQDTGLSLGKILYSLANQVAGANLHGHEAIAINEALIYVLKDKLSFLALNEASKTIWGEALNGQAGTALTYPQKAQLNSILHFDEHVDTSITCPGDVWLINRPADFFKLVSSNAEAEAQVTKFKQEVYDHANAQLICMEISPACDFSNNKKPLKSMALGVIVPKTDISNSAEGKLKKREGLLIIPITYSNEPSVLIISKKYVMAVTNAKIANLQRSYAGKVAIVQKILRMRETLLLSWIQSIASHNSRIGTVSFH